jgi:hypothetical protein
MKKRKSKMKNFWELIKDEFERLAGNLVNVFAVS